MAFISNTMGLALLADTCTALQVFPPSFVSSSLLDRASFLARRTVGGMGRELNAIIFDMDGTLFDSVEAVPRSYAAAVLEGQGRFIEPAEAIANYGLGPGVEILTALLGRPSTPADLSAYHRHLRKNLWRVRPYPGMRETVEELATRYPLAVFTGADREAAFLLLDHMGLLDALTVVVGGDEVSKPKPAPDGILLTCQRLGLDPGEAAYVGDAPDDLLAACAAGVVAIAASWGHQFDPAAPADEVAAGPGDLLRFVP
jgi:HAD superfamily hydrolase (TIGR01509 family)